MAKILVVDDEKIIVKGIRFSLEQDGMEVDCAYDGNEAIEKARYPGISIHALREEGDAFLCRRYTTI